MILAGDIGGTKTVIALYEAKGDRLVQCREEVYRSREHGSLEAILKRFLSKPPDAPLRAAGFGVAGAVIDGRSQATNLPWVLEEGSLAEACGVPRALLLNDLEAAAYGMLELDAEERVVLQAGSAAQRRGNVAVIAAGTGLGEAYLVWDGTRYLAMASEGGHAGFAPTSDEQVELLKFLQADFGRVSTERVLSGPGVHNLYRFARAQSGVPEPGWLSERFHEESDPSAVVGQVGVAGEDPVCAHALELFAAIYGSEAGDMALNCVATGGVFVGGGIAPKLLPVLRSGTFIEAFRAKGRFTELLSGLEVSVAINPRTPLLGAARRMLASLDA